MTGDRINITDGWIARHTPKGAGSGGRDAAVIDIGTNPTLSQFHSIEPDGKTVSRSAFEPGVLGSRHISASHLRPTRHV